MEADFHGGRLAHRRWNELIGTHRDVRRWLFGEDSRDPLEKRRRSARVSRQLRLLRAHGISHKISGTQYYLLSDKGRLLLSALSAAHQADAQSLTRLAA